VGKKGKEDAIPFSPVGGAEVVATFVHVELLNPYLSSWVTGGKGITKFSVRGVIPHGGPYLYVARAYE